jgi:hypothetical protein
MLAGWRIWIVLALNERPREKPRAVNARHSYSPRTRHPSHLHCELVVVAALPCSVVEEVYLLVFVLLALSSQKLVSLSSPSMYSTLHLNQALALVARGLCISQAVVVLDCVFNCKICFPVMMVMRVLALKEWEVVIVSLLFVTVHVLMRKG